MTANEVLQSVTRQVFAPKENLSSCEWIEKYCSLPAKTSNKKGQYSTSYTPYVRELFNILDNNRTQVVTIVKGTQLGLSLFSALALTNIACEKQQNAIYYSINKNKVADFSAQKFYPVVFNCNKAKEILPQKNQKELLKQSRAEFLTCTIALESANALSSFKSSSACYVFFDEIDSATDFKGEAPSDKLAYDRITSYGNDGKIFYFSSPTDTNSKIWKLFLEGSQEYFNVPCPHCQHLQVLDFWKQMKWDKGTEEFPLSIDQRAATARYECINCGHSIHDKDKLAMLDKGKWIATNEKCSKDKRSFHISSLYSCDLSWPKLVKEFLEAKESDNLENLRAFKNSRLAEIYESVTVNNSVADIDALIAASPVYSKGVLSFHPTHLVCSCDVQRAVLYYVIEATDSQLRRYVIDYGTVPEFDSLYQVLNRTYSFGGKDYQLEWSWVDCGYRPEEVYELCFKNAPYTNPCRGVNKEYGAADVTPSMLKVRSYKLACYDLKDPFYKMRVIRGIIEQKTKTLFLPKDTDNEFKRQLIDEKIILKKHPRTGKVFEDFKDGQRNHYFDCVKYNEALLDFVTNREIPEEAPIEYELKAA